jgi:ParB-like chromosome segregation protein Spo0J
MRAFIPLPLIDDNPFQTRAHYDAAGLVELADSIERDGQLQPPRARLLDKNGRVLPPSAGRFQPDGDLGQLAGPKGVRAQLAFGHRRARAWALVWKRAGEPDLVGRDGKGLVGVPPGTIPVELVELTDEAMADQAMNENRHRQDVSAVEEAEGIALRIERFGWSLEEVARRYGYARPTVSNFLRLLILPEEVRELNRTGKISQVKARTLVPLYTCINEHAELIPQIEGRATLKVRDIIETAINSPSAERVAEFVRGFVENVEREAARRADQAAPVLFSVEEAPADDGEEPITLANAQAELARLRAELRDVEGRFTGAVTPEAVDEATLERVVHTLQGLSLAAAELHVAVNAAGFLPPELVGSANVLAAQVRGARATYANALDRKRTASTPDVDASAPPVEPVDTSAEWTPPADVDASNPLTPAEATPPAAEAPAPAPVSAETPATPGPAWPEPELAAEFAALTTRTKAQLADLDRERALDLTHPGYSLNEQVSSNDLKGRLVEWVGRRLRNEANLACALRLTVPQVDQVEVWLSENVAESKYQPGRYESTKKNGLSDRAAHEYGQFRRTLALELFDGLGAVVYRRGAVRQILATCYDEVTRAMGVRGEVKPRRPAVEAPPPIEPPAPAPADQEAVDEVELRAAGARAFHDGHGVHTNPHPYPWKKQERAAWTRGYDEAMREARAAALAAEKAEPVTA